MNSIKEWIQTHGILAVVPSLTRLALTFVIGWLTKMGLTEEANQVKSAEEQIVAIAVAAAGSGFILLWSLWEKSRNVPTTTKDIAIERGVRYAAMPEGK